MDARNEIELGKRVITKLKALYATNEIWSTQLSNDLAKRLSGLKKRLKIYYPDEDEIGLLKIASKMNQDDLKDACELDKN